MMNTPGFSWVYIFSSLLFLALYWLHPLSLRSSFRCFIPLLPKPLSLCLHSLPSLTLCFPPHHLDISVAFIFTSFLFFFEETDFSPIQINVFWLKPRVILGCRSLCYGYITLYIQAASQSWYWISNNASLTVKVQNLTNLIYCFQAILLSILWNYFLSCY